MMGCLKGLIGIILAFAIVVLLFGLVGHWLGHLFGHVLIFSVVLSVCGVVAAWFVLSRFRKTMNG